MEVLVVDVGGSHVKVAIANSSREGRFDSGPSLDPKDLVRKVTEIAADWPYDVISLGFPGPVGPRGPLEEPGNLGAGWVGFDFEHAFGKPVRIVNDAAMQALGAYDGGRMLFLGLGTGLGSTLVVERIIVPLELGELGGADGRTLADELGRAGLERDGVDVWRQRVVTTAVSLRRVFRTDYVVLGGGNADRLDRLPPHIRSGGNIDAITGGARIWRETVEPHDRQPSRFWRVVQ